MCSKEDIVRMRHILDAAKEAVSFTQGKTKRAFLDEWCRAMNQHGGFGKWSWAVSFDPNDLQNLLENAESNKNS